MRWEQPWLLLAMLVVPALAAWSAARERRRASVLWVRARIAGVRGGLASLGVRGLELLPWAALSRALLAVARPQQGLRQSEVETQGVDIMLAIDISPSMAAEDFQPANRLTVATLYSPAQASRNHCGSLARQFADAGVRVHEIGLLNPSSVRGPRA